MKYKEDRRLLKLKVFENAQSFYEKEFSEDADITVGRAEQCDLVLRSKRVSREHCRIFCQDGIWQIEDLNSQNGIRVNNVKTGSQTLKNGDNLQVGDFRLEIILDDAPPVSDTIPEADDRTVLLQDVNASDMTIVRSPDFLAGSPGPEKKNVSALLKDKRVMAGAAGLFLVFLILIFAFSSGEDTQAPETSLLPAEQEKTAAMMDLESRHRMEQYLDSGKQQFDAGNYNEALVRFQAVLRIDPENETALSYLGQSREKILKIEEQKRQAAEEAKIRRERVAAILSRARQAMGRADYATAAEIVVEARYLAPDDPSVTSVATEIETAMATEKRKNEIASLEKEKKLNAIKEHFDAGQRYYDQGSYNEALAEWEQVLASGVETPETAHVRHAIGHLKTQLAENVSADYEKGKSYFNKKDYARAIGHLEKVARVLPDYQDTGTLLAQAVNALESDAKRLFQEGLVYEGIGQNEKAAAKWREVLKVMPVETNEYYQKALEKLR